MMKSGLLAFSVMALVFPVRAAEMSADSAEIVLAEEASDATRIAARELSFFLEKAFGRSVPTVSAPTDGKRSIVLGENAWSRAAGIDPKPLPRDSFVLKTVGDRLFVVGVDDARKDPEQYNYLGSECLWQPQFERGTLFGVYELLERHFGVRMYFPGELGTVVPRRDRVAWPQEDRVVSPVFSVRRYGYADGAIADEAREGMGEREWKRLNFYRLRGETAYIPCCHGQNKFGYLERFGRTHPEYFAQMPDGRRMLRSDVPHPGHICLTSAIWDEMYEDARSYLKGEDASVRGIPSGVPGKCAWGRSCSERMYVDLMCQDGLLKCHCERCKAAYNEGKDWARELIWTKTAEIANRLAAEGIPGYITQMAYTGYRSIPDVAIPSNVLVMVAERGPWSVNEPERYKRDTDQIRSWTKKLVHKVWIWTYLCKWRMMNLPGIPNFAPRACAKYYGGLRDAIMGAFAESESESVFNHYLDYYVLSRYSWDPDADVDQILKEHHRLMFGAGADDMAAVFDTIEEKWCREIAGKTSDTMVGPQGDPPDEGRLWTEVYSPAVIDELERRFDAAQAKVSAGSLEAKRIAFFRRQYFDPLAKLARGFIARSDPKIQLAEGACPQILADTGFSGPALEPAWTTSGALGKFVNVDTATFLSAPSSLRVDSTNRVTVWQPLSEKRGFLFGRRYRVSFNVKLDHVEPLTRGGGAAVLFRAGSCQSRPLETYLAGTCDWRRHEYEVLAPQRMKAGGTLRLEIGLHAAKGTAWFDDVRVELLPERAEDASPIRAVTAEIKDGFAIFRGTLDCGPMNECRGETVLPFVVLKDVDGKETTLAGGRGPKTMMSIPLSRLPPGDIPYTFEMRTRLGASVRGFVDGVLKRPAPAVLDAGWSIVAPAKEPSGVSKALHRLAEELRDAIEESVGLRLKVVFADRFKGGRAIYLGAAAAEKAGLMPADLKGYQNVIAEKDGDVYLFGRDCSGKPNQADVNWTKCVLPTVKAAARFMERNMNVRFLAPGKVGMDVPKLERIELAAGMFSRHSPDQVYAPSRLDTMLYSYAANQVGAGKFHTYGGHTYPSACPPSKYFKDHPEYFGLVGGKRVGVPERNPTLCISNPAVEDLIVKEMLARYDEGSDVCQLGQNDGGQFCECENCRNYAGVRDLGEQLWIFHRRIAERIEKLRPGKIVHIMCYGPTATPPKTFRKFPSNVMIEQCRATDEAFRAWEGYDVPHGFTVYIYLWGNYPFLGAMAKHSYVYLADFVHMLQRNNVHGVYRCGYGEFYGMEGPGYYVFNNLLETPEADVNALVDEYCERAYGPAAATMRTFHDTVDCRLRATDRIADSTYEHGGKGLSALRKSMPKSALDLHAYVYAPDVVAKLDECLGRAEQTKGLSEKQRIRLRLVRLEYDYARTMGRIATFYAAYRFAPTKETFAFLGEEIEHRNALIDSYTRGKAHVPHLREWPEIRFFGGVESKVLRTNGRLSATIGAPLAWDVSFLKGHGLLPGAEVKSLKVSPTAAEPDFADFEKGAWSAAAWQELGGCQLEAVPLTARFKALAGPDAFYLAAETDLSDDIRIKGCEHDGPAWREESFDMLVDPTGSKDRYYHFIWNPAETSIFDEAYGLITDKLDPKYNSRDSRWNGQMEVKTARANGKWRTQVKVPYASIGATRPSAGDRWLFNLGRAANLTTGKSADIHLMLWNPNLAKSKCLTDPDAMGVLIFE